MTAKAANETDREVVVSRLITHPRRLVFEAFTTAAHLAQWSSPSGSTMTTDAFEFRPGGEWRATIEAPDRSATPIVWTWKEIVAPERIVWLYGTSKDDPQAVPMTVTLVEDGARTEVTLRALFRSRKERDARVSKNYAVRARQRLDLLAEYVATLSAGGRSRSV